MTLVVIGPANLQQHRCAQTPDDDLSTVCTILFAFFRAAGSSENVKEVKPPAGAAQTVEFSAPGDFDKTVAFYREALPKAGFELGPEVKLPERKVYSLNFTRAGVQDTLAIFPDKSDTPRPVPLRKSTPLS